MKMYVLDYDCILLLVIKAGFTDPILALCLTALKEAYIVYSTMH